MALDVASLPREPDVLIGMLVELHDENGRLRAMLETAKRALYGARSERLGGDAAQLPLGLDDVSAVPVEPAVKVAQAQPREAAMRARAARNIGGLPRHLPREDVVIGNRCGETTGISVGWRLG
jgi:transposase